MRNLNLLYRVLYSLGKIYPIFRLPSGINERYQNIRIINIIDSNEKFNIYFSYHRSKFPGSLILNEEGISERRYQITIEIESHSRGEKFYLAFSTNTKDNSGFISLTNSFIINMIAMHPLGPWNSFSMGLLFLRGGGGAEPQRTTLRRVLPDRRTPSPCKLYSLRGATMTLLPGLLLLLPSSSAPRLLPLPLL